METHSVLDWITRVAVLVVGNLLALGMLIGVYCFFRWRKRRRQERWERQQADT